MLTYHIQNLNEYILRYLTLSSKDNDAHDNGFEDHNNVNK